jgi:hypothetical protein
LWRGRWQRNEIEDPGLSIEPGGTHIPDRPVNPALTKLGRGTRGSLLMFDKFAGLEFAHGGLQFGLGVHYDRAIPGDRLFKRLARDEQETDSFWSGLHCDFVATVEEDERVVLRVVLGRRVRIDG